MKRLLFAFLLWPVLLWGQNFGGIDYICGAAAGKTVLCYRMPDSANAIRATTANARGFFRFNLESPGVYLVKYVQGAGDTVSVSRFSYIPIVGIGGDSTSDAGAIIQKAIDSLPSSGGVLYLSPGVHLVSTGITINKDNVHIKGIARDACVVKAANSLNGNIFTNTSKSNTTFEDFTLNGNKGNQTAGGGFNFNGSAIRNPKWKNIHIMNTYDNGITLANGISGFDIEGCTFDSIGPAGQTSVTASFPVYIVTSVTDGRLKFNNFNWWSGTAAVRINNNCRRIYLTGNKYLSNDKTGIADRRAVFAGAASNDSCRDIHLKDEYAFNIDENGFYFNFVDSTSYDHCVADSCGNNGFEINGNSFIMNACQSRRNTTTGFATNNAKGGALSGNIAELNGQRGIYIFAATGDSTTDISAIGNVCRANSRTTDTTWAGIEVGATGTGKCRRITLIGNPCGDAVAALRQRFGIQTTNDVDYYTIVGNIVTPKGSGAASGLNDGGTGINKYVPAGGNP